MSTKYGVKIKKFVAGQLAEELMGCREKYHDNHSYKPAMLSRSLFLEFLENNGLKVNKSGSTLDVISIDFSQGTSSYEGSRKRVENILKDEKDEGKIEKLNHILDFIDANKDKFEQISKEGLRRKWYNEGLSLTYVSHKKSTGEVVKTETVHYNMLYRSAGMAKVGSCIFICDRLYKKAVNYIRMGIELPETGAKLVEMGAYSSLIASSIKGTIQIDPDNVLVVDDTEDVFNIRAMNVKVVDGHIDAEEEVVECRSVLNDGMALLSIQKFPDWGLGYVLLRNHMTKCAALKTDIKQFFIDWCKENGKDYNTYQISDVFGQQHYLKDIEMICTTETMKWLKFAQKDKKDKMWVQFKKAASKQGNKWGVVKTAKPSKLLKGKCQRTSYQIINSLDIDSIESVTQFTKDYIGKLKNDNETFIDYLRDNSTYSNDYDVLVALYEHCGEDFARCDYFQNRRSEIIKAYVKKFKGGKVWIEGADNLVLFGNPYALLKKVVGENPFDEGIFTIRDDCIECSTPRFGHNEKLAGFRSPHNSPANILPLYNIHNDIIDKYFELTSQCIAVNCIGTDIQNRANG